MFCKCMHAAVLHAVAYVMHLNTDLCWEVVKPGTMEMETEMEMEMQTRSSLCPLLMAVVP